MKTVRVLQMFVAAAIVVSLIACSKDDPQEMLPSKTFPLYNYSSGSAKTAGSFTLYQLDGGKVSVTMQLNSDYLIPGSSLDAYLTTCDTCSLIYATLGTVNGNSGTGSTGAIKTDGNNELVIYDSLIVKSGYAVKILNGSNVQAVGTIR